MLRGYQTSVLAIRRVSNRTCWPKRIPNSSILSPLFRLEVPNGAFLPRRHRQTRQQRAGAPIRAPKTTRERGSTRPCDNAKKRAPQPEGAFCQSTSRFAALGRLWLRVRAPLTFFAKEKPLFRALCFRQKNRRPVARGVKTPPNLPSPGKMTPRAAGYVLRTEG